MRRLLLRFLLFPVAPLLIFLAWSYAYLHQSLPQDDGVIRLPGLSGNVSIVRDEFGVVHVKAESDSDAFFGLGFAHAQDRIWQMEYQRRLGSGRLSEILGPSALPTDKFMRTLRIRNAAKASLRNLSLEGMASLDAYAKGVNAWLERKEVLPLEFQILGSDIEAWTAEDSLLQIKLFALNLGQNYQDELLNEVLIKDLGPVKASQLRVSQPGDDALFSTLEPDGIFSNLLGFSLDFGQEHGIGGQWVGSNAWALSGKWTSSRYPMLGADPHLGTQLPSQWYLAEIEGDTLHVAGATTPGLPIVVIGHNESIAWGITNLLADAQDLFLERTHVTNDNRYEVDGTWREMDILDEVIRVAPKFPAPLYGEFESVEWKARSTTHGPLISDVVGRASTPLALRWTALDDGDGSYEGFLRLNYANNLDEFRSALSNYGSPALNFVYADTSGNIASQAAGKIPLRGAQSGRYPVAGWLSTNDWIGAVPYNQMPAATNPPDGYVISANDPVHNPSYPHLISNSWAPNYRADRIKALLDEVTGGGDAVSLEGFSAMQADVQSLQAGELLPFLTDLRPNGEDEVEAIAYFENWDGSMSDDSVAGALYQSWLRLFYRKVVSDDLKENALYPERNQQVQNQLERVNPVFLSRVVYGDFAGWCDDVRTEPLETCKQMASLALGEALDELRGLAGGSMGSWKWGELHKTVYKHSVFGDAKLLEMLFNRSIPNGGDGYSINSAPFAYVDGSGYVQQQGPTYRQVLDLGNLHNGQFMVNTGQSGDLLSEHYDDLIAPHQQGRLLNIHFGMPIEGGTVLTLVPTSR